MSLTRWPQILISLGLVAACGGSPPPPQNPPDEPPSGPGENPTPDAASAPTAEEPEEEPPVADDEPPAASPTGPATRFKVKTDADVKKAVKKMTGGQFDEDDVSVMRPDEFPEVIVTGYLIHDKGMNRIVIFVDGYALGGDTANRDATERALVPRYAKAPTSEARVELLKDWARVLMIYAEGSPDGDADVKSSAKTIQITFKTRGERGMRPDVWATPPGKVTFVFDAKTGALRR